MAAHSSCSRARKPSGGTISPPSDRIGPTIRQAMVPRKMLLSEIQDAVTSARHRRAPAEKG